MMDTNLNQTSFTNISHVLSCRNVFTCISSYRWKENISHVLSCRNVFACISSYRWKEIENLLACMNGVNSETIMVGNVFAVDKFTAL